MPSRTLLPPTASAKAAAQQTVGLLGGGAMSQVQHSGWLFAAGATGGVGKRVVQRLLAQGRVVRALVRDVDKAKELLVSNT